MRRIIDALRQTLAAPKSGADLLTSVKARIDELADAEVDQLEAAQLAMRSTKAVVSADIERFERRQLTQPPSTAALEWLTSMLKRYEAWLTRLSPPQQILRNRTFFEHAAEIQ